MAVDSLVAALSISTGRMRPIGLLSDWCWDASLAPDLEHVYCERVDMIQVATGQRLANPILPDILGQAHGELIPLAHERRP